MRYRANREAPIALNVTGFSFTTSQPIPTYAQPITQTADSVWVAPIRLPLFVAIMPPDKLEIVRMTSLVRLLSELRIPHVGRLHRLVVMQPAPKSELLIHV